MRILEFTENTNNNSATLKVEIITKVFEVKHILKLSVDTYGVVLADELSSPSHPHINRRNICLDYKVRNDVRSLCSQKKLKDALILVASALEVINMRSAYPAKYQHLRECASCRKWRDMEEIRTCTICRTSYCAQCARQCDCGSPLRICAKCNPEEKVVCLYCVLDKKLQDVNILRLELDPKAESILLSNNIRTVTELEKLINGNTKIKGIGPARIASMGSALGAYKQKVSGAVGASSD